MLRKLLEAIQDVYAEFELGVVTSEEAMAEIYTHLATFAGIPEQDELIGEES